MLIKRNKDQLDTSKFAKKINEFYSQKNTKVIVKFKTN